MGSDHTLFVLLIKFIWTPPPPSVLVPTSWLRLCYRSAIVCCATRAKTSIKNITRAGNEPPPNSGPRCFPQKLQNGPHFMDASGKGKMSEGSKTSEKLPCSRPRTGISLFLPCQWAHFPLVLPEAWNAQPSPRSTNTERGPFRARVQKHYFFRIHTYTIHR